MRTAQKEGQYFHARVPFTLLLQPPGLTIKNQKPALAGRHNPSELRLERGMNLLKTRHATSGPR
jgi:hypothetical protein